MKNLTKIAVNTEGPLYVLFHIFTTLFSFILKPFFNMKPFLTCVLLCFANCLFAQIPKGKIMSEVGLNFSKIQERDDPSLAYVGFARTTETVYFNLFITNRFFIKNNFYIPLSIGYSNYTRTLGSSGERNMKGYYASIGLGRLWDLGDKFYLGADINFGIGDKYVENLDQRLVTPRSNTLQYFTNIKPQVYYQFHPRFLGFVGFGQIEYSYRNFEIHSTSNNFNTYFSPRFWHYGFVLLWGKSKV
jgi:hypothetical protein